MARVLALVLLSSGLCAPAACATLPDYAAPTGQLIDPATVDLSDAIPYRTLVRADFKGSAPPPHFAAHRDRIGAATCAYLYTSPEMQMRVEPIQSGGKLRYRATPQTVEFYARMDRKCSWWNPVDLGLPEDYILQHEQIHFALFELEARRLNRSIGGAREELSVTASSAQTAAKLLQQRLEERVQDHIDAVLTRSRKFDEDTSMGHRPENQKRWWKRVSAELKESGG